MTPVDLKRIVTLLGAPGAVAGMRASQIPVEDLEALAKRVKLPGKKATGRDELIDRLVNSVRIDSIKPTDELLRMSYDELIAYFSETSPSSAALMNIMRELNYKVGSEDKKHLRRFVARQISETALFSNVASRASGPDGEEVQPTSSAPVPAVEVPAKE